MAVVAWVVCAVSMTGGQAQTPSPTAVPTTLMPTPPPSPAPTLMPTPTLTTTTQKIPTKLVIVKDDKSQEEKNLELADRIIGWGVGAIAGTCICWGAFWIVFTIQQREKRKRQHEEALEAAKRGNDAKDNLIAQRGKKADAFVYHKKGVKKPRTFLEVPEKEVKEPQQVLDIPVIAESDEEEETEV